MMLEIFKDFSFIAGSYLAGAIPFCYILGKLVSGKKLTEIGDKNPGGWNLVFNVSKVWGFAGIMLDMAKGYLAYFLAYRFAGTDMIEILTTPNNRMIAVLAGCAAVAGHNYPPYLKFKGGKGLATWGGFMIAAHPLTVPFAAAGLLFGLLVARNMIWSIALGIICSGIFLWVLKDSVVFAIMTLVLILIMIPKQINPEKSLGANFKFRKEATLGDLFKPKIR